MSAFIGHIEGYPEAPGSYAYVDNGSMGYPGETNYELEYQNPLQPDIIKMIKEDLPRLLSDTSLS